MNEGNNQGEDIGDYFKRLLVQKLFSGADRLR
jgi:hypothetical protein